MNILSYRYYNNIVFMYLFFYTFSHLQTPIFSNPLNKYFQVSIIGCNIKKVGKINSRIFTYDFLFSQLTHSG